MDGKFLLNSHHELVKDENKGYEKLTQYVKLKFKINLADVTPEVASFITIIIK